ncbi:copper radical oxidase [Infundibulicybe gibba]|nr:copper radical oxidase [Infundibulicybe gibba]
MAAYWALFLALALSYSPLTQASEHIHASSFRHRRQTLAIPKTLPGTWTSKGCFTDNTGSRTLNGATFTDGKNMTIENCIRFCDSKSFIFAGTEFDCDNFIQKGGVAATSTDCNTPCTGNTLEPCGAGGRLNVFTSGKPPPAPPSLVSKVGNWTALGCYSDAVNGAPRTLPNAMTPPGSLTIESCTTTCFNAGFQYSGTEFSDLYIHALESTDCGSSIASTGVLSAVTDCNMVCAGNSSEFCGGPNRLSLYNLTGAPLPAGVPQGGNAGGGTSSSVFPVTSGLPAPWKYAACYVDNAFGRILTTQVIPAGPTMTVQTCVAACVGQNFTLAGLEFADCGNTLVDGAVPAVESTCNMGCAANTTEACGGPNRLSVYTATGNVTALPVPVAQTTNLPGQWKYQGCLREPDGARVFLLHNIWPTNNTATACLNQCAAFGYPAAGMEDIWTGSECNTPCPGDPIHLCGSGDRLSLYFWNGTMNVWHTPTNTGRYEVFTFLEKGGTGVPNATGAYELDLTLTKDFSKTWREMHIKTDVFCSGSIILPDKAGRQINVGGWSEQSTFGVRLYTPSGSAGVNGTTDWEEDFTILSLQVGRWYPTAAMLSNGSILVIGGETGSNAAPQPNLEILPKPPGGPTLVDLDWLAELILITSIRPILDPVTFDTIKQLPNIPAAVDDFLGGRTYPLEACPYTDPLQILICGGSGVNGGNGLDNCVTIAPEAPNPTWVLERMVRYLKQPHMIPSRRVMPCMVALPDGTYMIMNGALLGVAGFGLARDPNLSAILYDPTQAVGQRFSILNNTIVARMYHSEAILLPDGRVLISGSDPQTDDGVTFYPEEYRVEVYIPPYLNQGFTQPQFNISVTDWAYGGKFTITNVKLFQGTTAAIKVSLVSAVSSTHGNSMGARTIFPAFTCSGTTCTITAPPNAGVSPPGWYQLFILDGPTPSHSAWVRIGGDPSKLGNWPNLPGFTVPGL